MSQITLEQIRQLMSPDGQRALAAVATCPQTIEPATIVRLRASFSPELVSASLTLGNLRVRARERFGCADAMYFDGSDLLEQATSEPLARHKALRFAGLGTVIDLCCGAGGDALQIAGQAGGVIGVDCSPARLVCLQANARAYGVADRVRAVAADIEQWVPRGDACHIDPPRRDDTGRRQLTAAQWDPWIQQVRHLAGSCKDQAAKLSPAIDLALLDWADEVEFISENGTLKQAMTWCGRLARSRRSATVIRSASGLAKATETLASDQPVATPPRASPLEPGQILHEPDGAIVRAGLLGNLAEQLDAGLVDPHLPLLTGLHLQAETLLARQYQVLEIIPWSIKKVRQLIRQRGWHVADVKTRAFACQPEVILSGLRSLKPDPGAPVVVLWAVRLGDRPTGILTQRIVRSSPGEFVDVG